MSIILKTVRNAYRNLKFKIASIYKGDKITAFETSIAFNKKFKPKQKVSLKYQTYPQLNKYFLQFVNSADSAGRVNGDNLAFLIGGQGGGKTSYVETNLQHFKLLKLQSKSKPQQLPEIHKFKSPEYVENQTKQTVFQNQHHLLFNFNFQKNRATNFNIFLQDIHDQIIQEIVKLNNKFKEGPLDCQVIKEIIITQNAAQYIYIYMKDVIFCIFNDIDIIQLSEKGRQQLSAFNEIINDGKIQAQTFFQKNGLYRQVIDIICKDLKIAETEAALRLFLSIGKRIQYQNRPQTHMYSWYQTGIQSTDILFDILNYLCGFGKIHKQYFNQYFFKQMVQNQQQGELTKQKIDQNLIKNYKRIDVAMFFLNMNELYFYDSVQFWNFIDHLISRLSNSSGLRTHFPLLLQFPNYSDFQDMHNMGQFNYGTPIVIELPGYTLYQLMISNANVAHLFNQRVLNQLFFSLGRNPNTWNKAIMQMAQGSIKIHEIIKHSAKYIEKQGISVEAKINKIFTSKQILPQLCDNSARYELVQHIRLIMKGNGLLLNSRPGIYIDFYTRPIFKLLLKQNLLYQHYYLPYVDVNQLTNSTKLNDIKNQLLKGHVCRFLQWRFKNKHRFNYFSFDVKFKKSNEADIIKHKDFRKRRAQGQLAETYYGTRFSYVFHYAEKGIEKDAAS